MKIMVGLSGGVDSAVAAYLLKQQGHDVTCGFMRNWDSLVNDDIKGNPTINDSVCSQEQDYKDAQSVAQMLGLPLVRVDFIQEYWQEVFQRFLEDYRKGRTPNPDILCNQYIKFDSFYQFAKQQGFEKVATGHYAHIVYQNNQPYIAKSLDLNKDQTYFLCQINPEVVQDIVFPLGEIDKPTVRKIAEELGLSIAKKKDSTGICFIGERNFREFLSNYLPMKPGKIIHVVTHEVLGEHKGVLYYTIGQRKGLDIGGIGPFYVCGKDVEKNHLYVTDEKNIEWIYSDSCIVENINWLKPISFPYSCHAKFRYRQGDCPVTIEQLSENKYMVRYPQNIKSVTPGQEAVLYDQDVLLGGGVVDVVLKNGEDLMKKINQQFE